MDEKKKLYIVIEDTDAENFSCYMAGDTDRIGKVSPDELTGSEYWGAQLFEICIKVLGEAGVIKSESTRPALTPETKTEKGTH